MCNVGGIDRWLRIIVGLVIIAAGIVFKSWLGVIGVIPLFTGIFGFCPLYKIVGISTCKLHPHQHKQGGG